MKAHKGAPMRRCACVILMQKINWAYIVHRTMFILWDGAYLGLWVFGLLALLLLLDTITPPLAPLAMMHSSLVILRVSMDVDADTLCIFALLPAANTLVRLGIGFNEEEEEDEEWPISRSVSPSASPTEQSTSSS
jgi:hypothetical protein